MAEKMNGGALMVEVIYHGALLALPVRDVTMRDEEKIEDAYPAAKVPMIESEKGARLPDFTDLDYLRESRRIDRNRKVARIATAILPGNEIADGWFAGATTIKERVERLKDVLQEWQADHLAVMIRAPKLVTEEDVRQEIETLLPTSAAATEAT